MKNLCATGSPVLIALIVSVWGVACSDSSNSTSSGPGGPSTDGTNPNPGAVSGGTSGSMLTPMSGGESVNTMTCMEGTCPAGSGCDPVSMTCLPLCLPNGDCPEGRQCTADGLCCLETPCTQTSDCSGTMVCNTCKGVCVAAGRKACEREGDLRCSKSRERGYEYCDLCSMQCRPVAGSCGACQTDAQCGDRALCAKTIVAGTETTTGTCLRTCSTDANCELIGPTFECAEVRPGRKACAPRAGNQCEEVPACQMDADCPPDRYCESGRCLQGCTEEGVQWGICVKGFVVGHRAKRGGLSGWVGMSARWSM